MSPATRHRRVSRCSTGSCPPACSRAAGLAAAGLPSKTPAAGGRGKKTSVLVLVLAQVLLLLCCHTDGVQGFQGTSPLSLSFRGCTESRTGRRSRSEGGKGEGGEGGTASLLLRRRGSHSKSIEKRTRHRQSHWMLLLQAKGGERTEEGDTERADEEGQSEGDQRQQRRRRRPHRDDFAQETPFSPFGPFASLLDTQQMGNVLPPLSRREAVTSTAAALASLGAMFASAEAGLAASARDSPAGRSMVVVGEIEKSPRDSREYRGLVLPNGLKVLLVSDPGTKNAAAAMDVHVGHYSDPDVIPGLAHFCEHMLFLGTSKYPDENAYSSYLSKHGGSSNAYTEADDTCYFFDVNADYLEGALDLFAQFFISPQFTTAATERELNAIESENKKNLQSDSFRVYQLEKSRANPLHPQSKFGTGNMNTLLEEPKRLGIDTRQALLDFYEANYAANRMALCVLGKESLNQLQKLVKKTFSDIPSRGFPPPASSRWQGNIPPYLPASSLTSYNVVPVTDARKLALSWMLPQDSPDAREAFLLMKPDGPIGSLLGHEGPGSLLSLLKKRNWANGLGVGIGENVDDLLSFQMEIDLTQEGFKHRLDIISAVFSYLRMVREEGIPSFVAEELRLLSDISWNLVEKGKPLPLVEGLSSNMQNYPLEKVLSGPVLRFRDSSDTGNTRSSSLSNALLSRLQPSNPLVTLVAKECAAKANLKEKWYGTRYSVEDLSSNLPQWEAAPLLPELHLPSPNPFIPRDLSLKEGSPEVARMPKKGDPNKPPTEVPRSPKWHVFVKQDVLFAQPKVYAFFELLTPEVYSSPRAVALLKLFQMSVDDALNEYAYDAQVAGLSYNLDFTTRGLRLAFGGFSDKMQQYISTVVSTIATHVPSDQATFNRFMDIVARELASFDKQQPYFHAVFNAAALTETPRYSVEDIRAALPSIKLSDFAPFLSKCFSRAAGLSLLEGNVRAGEADAYTRPVEEAFKFSPLPAEDVPFRRVTDMPLTPGGAGVVMQREEPNAENENSAALVQFQIQDRGGPARVLSELFATIIEDAFYDSLRTKQQLGYLVFSGIKRVEGISYLFYLIQSNVKDPVYLTDRILAFLEGWREQLEAMSASQISDFVSGLVESKLEPPQRLGVAAGRDWQEIADGEMNFNRQLEEAKILSAMGKADLLAFFDRFLGTGGEQRRVLTSQVFAKQDLSAMSPGGRGKRTPSGTETGTPSGPLVLLRGVEEGERFRAKRPLLPPRAAAGGPPRAAATEAAATYTSGKRSSR